MIDKLERKLQRLKNRIRAQSAYNSVDYYIEGQIDMLEDIIDLLQGDNYIPSPSPVQPIHNIDPYQEVPTNVEHTNAPESGPAIDISNRKPSSGIVDESF